MKYVAPPLFALLFAAVAHGQIDIESRSATIAGTGSTQVLDDSLYSIAVSAGAGEDASASLDRDRLNGDSPLNCTVNASIGVSTTASAGSAEIKFKVPTQLAEAAVTINPRAALSATSGFTVTIDGATQTTGQYALSGSSGFRDIEPFGAGTHEVKVTYNRPGNPSSITRVFVTISMKDPTQPHNERAIRWKGPVDGEWQEAKKWQDNLMPVRGDTAVFDLAGTFSLRDQRTRSREVKRVLVRGGTVNCDISDFSIQGENSGPASLRVERGGRFNARGPRFSTRGVALGSGAPNPAVSAELHILPGTRWNNSGNVDIAVNSPARLLVSGTASINNTDIAAGAGEDQGGTFTVDGEATAREVKIAAAKSSRGFLSLGPDAELDSNVLHVGAPDLSSGRVTLAAGSVIVTATVQGGGVQTGGTGSAKGGKAVFDLSDGGSILATSIFLGNSRSRTTPRAKMTIGGSGDGAFVAASERVVVGRFSPASIDCLAPGELRATNLEVFSKGRVTTAVGAAATPGTPTIFLTGTTPGTPALSLTGNAVLEVGAGTTMLGISGAEGFVGGGLESGLASLVLEAPPAGEKSLVIDRLTAGSSVDPSARGKIELLDGVLGCTSLFVRPNATVIGTGTLDLTAGTGIDEGEVLNAGTLICTEGPGTLHVAGRVRSVTGSKFEVRFQSADDPLANGLVLLGGNPLTTNFDLFGELIVRFTDFNPASGQRYRLVQTSGFLDPDIANDFTLTLVGRRDRILTIPATLEIGNGSIDLVID